MKIVFAASEAAPFIKTGGLGDVAQALPAALSEYTGNEILLFLPYYSSIKSNPAFAVEEVAVFETPLSWRNCYTGLYRLKCRKRKLQVYFIDNEQYFARDKAYGSVDDGERFAFFSKAILESLVKMGEKPDVIHCNDWQTALLPTMLHAFYEETLGSAKTVFTIHNIEYQGWADPNFLGDVLGLPWWVYGNAFTFNGSLNFVKSAILACDALTTVSRTYAKEICYPYFAHGLSDVIRDHEFKTVGIVNGIDMAGNDPATDRNLAQNYSAKAMAGKAVCKEELQKQLGLPVKPNTPMIGLVSRLVGHKGLDIMCAALDEMMSHDVQFVILGTGDPVYEEKLREAAARYPDKLSLNLRFNLALASQIYAAADIYLMPSKSEPCGLSQMMAMRYGTVPIVHETGGLKDTVIPFNPQTGEGHGFTFQQFTREDMLDAFYRASDVYYNNPNAWKKAIRNGMTTDFSWRVPAGEYMELYNKLINS